MLANAKTGIRDIAEFLLTPSRSGLWISKANIQELGRDFNVPRGFGDRLQMLSNLLRNAAEYELVDQLISALEALVTQQQQSYAALSAELAGGPYATHWQTRIATTKTILKAMASALPRAGEAETP